MGSFSWSCGNCRLPFSTVPMDPTSCRRKWRNWHKHPIAYKIKETPGIHTTARAAYRIIKRPSTVGVIEKATSVPIRLREYHTDKIYQQTAQRTILCKHRRYDQTHDTTIKKGSNHYYRKTDQIKPTICLRQSHLETACFHSNKEEKWILPDHV